MYKRHEALAHLSTTEERSASELAVAFGLTPEATRLRLASLKKEGAVTTRILYRPKRSMWKLVPGFVPKVHKQAPFYDRTISLVNKHMSVVHFQSAKELAPKFGCNPNAMAQRLLKLYDARIVERALDTSLEGGGNRYLWRKVPEGFIAPIYDAQPGVCGRALDAAMGGHSYLKANSTMRL